MAFQPAEMTEATLRRLVDNLVRHTKSNPISEAPKRSELQEAVAATLGWPSYHAAITTLKNKASSQAPNPARDSIDRPWVFPLIFPVGKHHRTGTVEIPHDWDSSGTLRKSEAGKDRQTHKQMARSMHAEVSNDMVASTIFLRTSEQTRSLVFDEILRLNPGRPLCVIQGPISLVKPMDSATFIRGVGIDEVLKKADSGTVFNALSKNLLNVQTGKMFRTLIEALVFLRDKHEEPLNKDTLQEASTFRSLEKIARDDRISSRTRQQLFSYLKGLPHYEPTEEVIEQNPLTSRGHSLAEASIHLCLEEAHSGSSEHRGILHTEQSPHRLQVVLPNRILASPEIHLIQDAVNHWAQKHKDGLVFIDSPPREQTDLWYWIFNSHTHWSSNGLGVWIAVDSTMDIPDDLGDRILRRADHHLGRTC